MPYEKPSKPRARHRPCPVRHVLQKTNTSSRQPLLLSREPIHPSARTYRIRYYWTPVPGRGPVFTRDSGVIDDGQSCDFSDRACTHSEQYAPGEFSFVHNCLGGGAGCEGTTKGCQRCRINPYAGVPPAWRPLCPCCVCEHFEMSWDPVSYTHLTLPTILLV